MELATQAGSTNTNMVGDLPGYGTDWFHPNGIANILALVNVKKNHKVEYNIVNGNEFIVTKNEGAKNIQAVKDINQANRRAPNISSQGH